MTSLTCFSAVSGPGSLYNSCSSPLTPVDVNMLCVSGPLLVMAWSEGTMRGVMLPSCVSGPLLVIVGGYSSGLLLISDCWIGDLTTKQWKKV